eukprot:1729072-Rhodomonas_salina.2
MASTMPVNRCHRQHRRHHHRRRHRRHHQHRHQHSRRRRPSASPSPSASSASHHHRSNHSHHTTTTSIFNLDSDGQWEGRLDKVLEVAPASAAVTDSLAGNSAGRSSSSVSSENSPRLLSACRRCCDLLDIKADPTQLGRQNPEVGTALRITVRSLSPHTHPNPDPSVTLPDHVPGSAGSSTRLGFPRRLLRVRLLPRPFHPAPDEPRPLHPAIRNSSAEMTHIPRFHRESPGIAWFEVSPTPRQSQS